MTLETKIKQIRNRLHYNKKRKAHKTTKLNKVKISAVGLHLVEPSRITTFKNKVETKKR